MSDREAEFEELKRDYERLKANFERQQAESLQQSSQSSPSHPARGPSSTIQFVQSVAEASPMAAEEDLEDYLAYFDTVYADIAVADTQLVAKLMSKLPTQFSRYISSLLRSKPTYEQVKKALKDQFGIGRAERQKRFEAMQYKEGQDVVQFILQAEQHLTHTRLPEQVIVYKIVEKLPYIMQQLVDEQDMQSVAVLLEKVRKLKDSNFIQVLSRSWQSMASSSTKPRTVHMFEHMQTSNSGNYSRRTRGRGRGRGRPSGRSKASTPVSEATNCIQRDCIQRDGEAGADDFVKEKQTLFFDL